MPSHPQEVYGTKTGIAWQAMSRCAPARVRAATHGPQRSLKNSSYYAEFCIDVVQPLNLRAGARNRLRTGGAGDDRYPGGGSTGGIARPAGDSLSLHHSLQLRQVRRVALWTSRP